LAGGLANKWCYYVGRSPVPRLVFKTLLALYWEIGRGIVEKQHEHGWGRAVVETLAQDLRAEFPGGQGYSADNLWRMRKCYLQYSASPKLAPLVQEIGWSHNIVIMEKCKDDLEREFYIQMTRKFGWSKNVLAHQVAVRFFSGMFCRKKVLNLRQTERNKSEREH
jgi:predicted nuclease of restriction endonuclease-like (RecB) superfamily